MMDNQHMMALAERVEGAEGPDRALDAKIELAHNPAYAGWIEHPANNGNQYGELAPSREAFDDWLIRDGAPCLVASPAYTASLDAAMTLVPEGRQFGCGSKDATGKAWAWCEDAPNAHTTLAMSNATTPALALTAACLKARALTPAPHNG